MQPPPPVQTRSSKKRSFTLAFGEGGNTIAINLNESSLASSRSVRGPTEYVRSNFVEVAVQLATTPD
jgi:hypothetical protein